MPTNLPPEYYEVAKRLKAAESVTERISLLEQLLGTIPKHKGTEHLRGDYKSRLAKLRTSQQSRRGTIRHASSFQIEREGAGQVVVIGVSNVGKSSLVCALTNANPQVSETPFTTWEPMPGMMDADSVPVQLIDTPALDRDYLEPELFDLLRRSDLVLLLVNLQADPFQQMETTLEQLIEHRIIPEHLRDDIAVEPHQNCIPLLIVANKCDDPASDLDCKAFGELLDKEWPILPISAASGRNLDALKRAILDHLDLVRVYAKPPGQEADLRAPFVLKSGSTIEELAGKVHKDFLTSLKFARVWGEAVHDGQMVGRDYILQDGDIVELRA